MLTFGITELVSFEAFPFNSYSRHHAPNLPTRAARSLKQAGLVQNLSALLAAEDAVVQGSKVMSSRSLQSSEWPLQGCEAEEELWNRPVGRHIVLVINTLTFSSSAQ